MLGIEAVNYILKHPSSMFTDHWIQFTPPDVIFYCILHKKTDVLSVFSNIIDEQNRPVTLV